MAAAAILLTSFGCRQETHKTRAWEDLSPEERLEVMRTDTSYISFLDSCARIHIGDDARCIDAVQHLFESGGRRWLFSDDWGGLLEIPMGWTPDEDRWQAMVTFHGTHAFSPDSTVLVSMYSGFASYGDEAEFREYVMESMAEDSISVRSWQVESIPFTEDWSSPAVTVLGRNAHGINFYGRYIMRDAFGVEHSASLQWEDGEQYGIEGLMASIDRFPFGPQGQVPHGDAAL